MSDDKKQAQEQPCLLLNGKPATKQEARHILGVRAQKSDPQERATKPISTVSRGFQLLR